MFQIVDHIVVPVTGIVFHRKRREGTPKDEPRIAENDDIGNRACIEILLRNQMARNRSSVFFRPALKHTTNQSPPHTN
jgi:hypothetical protein